MTTGPEIVKAAHKQLSQLTGLSPDTISSLVKEKLGWQVTVEMVEMKRIPESNDMLATYEVHLSDEGEVLSYRRTQRYLRDQLVSVEA